MATVGGNVFYYLETGINTDANAWEYRIIALNACGTEISSEIHRSVLLSGNLDEDLNIETNFTAYEGWDRGVDFYTHYMAVNYGPFGNALVANPGDRLVSLKTAEDFSKCFRVQAKEFEGEENLSWSNEI